MKTFRELLEHLEADIFSDLSDVECILVGNITVHVQTNPFVEEVEYRVYNVVKNLVNNTITINIVNQENGQHNFLNYSLDEDGDCKFEDNVVFSVGE